MSKHSEIADELVSGAYTEAVWPVIRRAAAALRELDALLTERTKQLGVACDKHDLIHGLACGRCHAELKAEVAHLKQQWGESDKAWLAARQENARLREMIKDAVEWADRHGKEPWWLEAFRAALEDKT